MKHLKILPVILSLVFLTACNSEHPVQTSETVSESETSAVTTTSAEITTEAETETVPETEPAEADEENSNGSEYVEVSIGNEFIDFEFVENYQGTTDIGDLADKAIEFVKSTEQYADSVKNIDKFSYKAIKEIHTDEKYAKEDADKVAPYINGGNIEPLVSAAYIADYDGDGKTETFIAVDIPYIVWSHPDVWSFLLFIDGSENADPVLLDFYEGYSASMLNYGKNKQLVFGGWDGMHSYASIYGVKDDKPVTLYDHCPGGYFRKTDCFLSVFGLQGWSDFMYFDTTVQEYRIIKGVEISRDEMAELDVSGTLCSHCNAESLDDLPDYAEFHFIKPNYYLIDWGFPGSDLFTYENGVFTYDKDSNITRSVNGSGLDIIAEFDIDKAVAEMKKPVEPFVKVSADNEFIDYKMIEDYRGTTDIGDLADKAVDFLMTAEEYAESMEHIAEFTDKESSDHFSDYIKDGKIIPKFNTAYPNDYDGDGRTETFVVADMPIKQGEQPLIRSFFIFADSDGHMTLLGNESNLYDTVLLDYGEFKQIIWGGFGTCGADENRCIYGVIGGQAKPLYSGRFVFCKENCFLTTHGHMSSGDFMYYDTAADKYIAIAGVEMTLDEIKAMDKEGALADYYEGDEYTDYFFGLVGGRYYCVNYGRDITEAVFTFDGKFERVENSNVRLRFKDRYSSGKAVTDIDINKAISEMKPVK